MEGVYEIKRSKEPHVSIIYESYTSSKRSWSLKMYAIHKHKGSVLRTSSLILSADNLLITKFLDILLF